MSKSHEFATTALNSSNSDTEEDIRVKVRDLLQNIVRKESTLLLEHRIESINRPCDIYLPEYRFVAEVKSVHSREASQPKPHAVDQLTSYIKALLDDELGKLPLDDPHYDSHREWIGIVTDGQNWHFYEWEHAPDTVRRTRKRLIQTSPEELVIYLEDVLKKNRRSGKTWIPENPNIIYEKHSLMKRLEELSGKPRFHHRKRQTCFRLWLRSLKTSGLVPPEGTGREKLFISHCYLVLIARCVVKTTTNRTQPNIDGPGLAENGFTAWLCDSEDGRNWLQELANVTHAYEWSGGREHDVLRNLYEDIITREDRKLFGEYYTPDWLAHWLCEQVMDDAWLEASVREWFKAEASGRPLKKHGVLDPTCGSGTFLIAASKRIRYSNAVRTRNLSPEQVGKLIAALVHGIDIHPVAVELATANLSRALPEHSQDLSLKVYLGDALRLESLDDSNQAEIFKSTFRSALGTEVFLPDTFLEKKDFPKRMRALVDIANPDKSAQLDSRPDVVKGLSREDKGLIEKAVEDLRTIIEDESNSIWAWYAEQAVGPALIEKNKVDRIVANPPWVTMKEIQDLDRKRALERMAGKPRKIKKNKWVPAPNSLGIWPAGKLAPLYDIAALFIHRCGALYLSKRWQAGWLANAAALRSETWEPLRAKRAQRWKRTVDFSELKEPPFQGAKSCAIIETSRKIKTSAINLASSSARIDRSGKPEIEIAKLKFSDKKVMKISPSDYIGEAYMGASLVPHVLVLADPGSISNDSNGTGKQLYTRRSKHSPWKGIEPIQMMVPAHWLLPVLQGSDLCPFYFPSTKFLATAIVPLRRGGKTLLGLEEACAHESYAAVSEIYCKYRGRGKGTPKTLLQQINHLSKLSRQLPVIDGAKAGRFVCYKKAGSRMGAARQLAGTVINDTLYRMETSCENEALYITSLLNAPSLSDAYKEVRTSDRDFHTRPWEKIPIARFDPEDKSHMRLAKLGKQAEHFAAREARLIMSKGWGSIKREKVMWEALHATGIFEEIDDIAHKLLAGYVSSPMRRTFHKKEDLIAD